MKNKLVVYTALLGNYDDLIDPKEKFEECDFICFTDQEHLQSDIWEIRIIEECDLSPNMMNRKYKILPHLFLGEYESSLYVDANIAILGNPLELVNKYLTKYDMAVPKHFARACVYAEAKECVILGKTKYQETKNQMNIYENEGFPVNFGLGENNIIFRKHKNEKIVKLMNDWWNELNTQTKRDQLSLAYVLWKNGEKFNYMDESARGNRYFKIKPHSGVLIENCRIYNYIIYKIHNYPNIASYMKYIAAIVFKLCKLFRQNRINNAK
ncbi:glycosyltransferase domain-containing protein [Sulfurovum sp.]|jgi:hypothetical protein|uniref:glycosyltransferase domain-containing protein n=1 Tax=Sulfurovum sp. TaxID=1969726 RepID=UPI002A35CE1B|nr:glycosyltransferase domain-containing protein [Sulfurovum sp.]MDY0402704.1 DUF616 domain-containing protein [Sulfurovum sp.]